MDLHLADRLRLVPNQDDAQPSRLDSLPHELIEQVVIRITRKRDLVNLGFCSQKLLKFVLPHLYRSIIFDCGDMVKHDGGVFMNMLCPSNEGLAEMRQLRFVVRPSDRELAQRNDEMLLSMAEALIMAVPKSTLESFRWSVTETLPTRLSQILWDRQPKLKTIELVNSEEAYGHTSGDRMRYRDHWQSQVKNLVIGKAATFDPRFSAGLLKWLTLDRYESSERPAPEQKSALQALVITIPTGNRDSSIEPFFRYDHAGFLLEDRFTDVLLAPWLYPAVDQSEATPIALTGLALCRLDLQHCDTTWSKAIDISRLTRVALTHNKNQHKFIQLLARSWNGRRAHLETLTVVDSSIRSGARDDLIAALNAYLPSVSSCLTSLRIVVHKAASLPNVDGLMKHGKTLKALLIDVYDFTNRPRQQLYYEQAPLRRLLSSMENLRQLAVALPPILTSACFKKDGLLALETDLAPSTSAYFNQILDLVDLRVLNILNLPNFSPRLSDDVDSLVMRELTKDITTALFHGTGDRAVKRPSLRLIAMGSWYQGRCTRENMVHIYKFQNHRSPGHRAKEPDRLSYDLIYEPNDPPFVLQAHASASQHNFRTR